MYLIEDSSITSQIGYILLEAAPDEPSKTDIVKEIQCGSKKRVVGKGILQSGNVKNRNGRIYDTEKELRPQVYAPRQQQELIPNGRMLGECSHPLSKDLTRQQQILEPLCSVRYLKIWMEGDDVWAWYVGHNNALGDTFDDNLRCGINPSFSLRALGGVNNTSRGAEVVNLKIITWDDVIYPSHSNAYGHGLVSDEDLTEADKKMIERGKLYQETCSLLESSMVPNDISEVHIRENGLLTPITNGDVIDFLKRESGNFHIMTECFDTLYDDIVCDVDKKLVQLTDKAGHILYVKMESYIHNGLMNYFYDK